MSNYSDAEWILSRKIVVKSLTRHFAPWKSRLFVLDRPNAVLGIRSSLTTGVVVVPLSEPSLSIQRHEYGAEAQNLLTIKYKEADSSGAIKEVVMKFDTLDHLTYWEKSLQSVTENVRSVTTSSTQALFQTFIEYVDEQSTLQSIVDSESQFEACYYGNTAAEAHTASNARYTDTPNSLDVSFTETTSATPSVVTDRRGGESCAVDAVMPSHSHILASLVQMRPLRVPRMHILLIAVGTRGDMQPFVQLGARLQRDGHRVRLATHACFRDYVVGKGLEFYPLAGDPLKLSEFMVKTEGFVIPTTPELLMEAPIYHRMVVEMMHSCWGACVDPDPQDPAARKFVADAIISNPVSYAHAHCAEALGIPLHLMFPQPWTPTKAFPHPLSCLSYQQGWSSENYISYQLVDTMLWMSFERHINAFRVNVLGLEPLRVGDGGWNHLNIMKVPFAKMWSPAFVPKPKDWPSYVDVVGTFFDTTVAFTPRLAALRPGKTGPTEGVAPAPGISTTSAGTGASTQASAATATLKPSVSAGLPPTKEMAPVVENQFKPPENLVRFLESGDTPVFVGFGSMVVKNLEALISLFLEGAALAGVRIIVQLGWSEITPARFLELALQAQLKASVVRETEHLHDHMSSSLIFPSAAKTAGQRALQTTVSTAVEVAARLSNAGGNGIGGVDLTMSVRSVESTSTVEEDASRDDSTLDGENLLARSNMYTSSLSASLHPSAPTARRTAEEGDYDVSPISTPESERHRSEDSGRARPLSTGVAGAGAGAAAGAGTSSGLGKWLYGAAATLSKSLQSTNPTVSSKPASDVPTPSSARLSGQSNSVSDDWDEVSADGWSAAKDALFIGSCPHDWLFQRVAGVVHHGGAGTTAAGLRFGCPTWICPFFGDQHFWGEMVHRREVGPKPCPVGALTVEIVADSLTTLQDRRIVANAAALAESMSREDGVESACSAFYKHLPLESMLCDVSLFRGEHRLAQIYCQDCGLKMCSEVSQHLHSAPLLHMQDHRLGPCSYKNWTRPVPNNAAAGLLQGLGGLVYELREGVSDMVYDPVHGIYSQGISGGAAGLSTGLQSLLSRPLAGTSVLLNKVKEGIRASLSSNLQYGVAASTFDPLAVASSTAGYETDLHPSADSPHTPHTSLHNRHKALKLTVDELPAVVEASLSAEKGDNFSPPQSPVGLPVKLGTPAGLSSGGRSSPRGMRVASEDPLGASGLAASQRSVVSHDSAVFYSKKPQHDSQEDGDPEQDGDSEDGSVYGEDDAVPFLLYSSGHEEDHAVKPLSPAALGTRRVETSSSEASATAAMSGMGRELSQLTGLQDPSSSLEKTAGAVVEKDSLGSQVNHSSGSSPADAHLTVRTAQLEEHTPTIEETYATAQAARRLFSDLGAKSGRLMSSVEFAKVMQRALHRDSAMQAAVDPGDSYDALDDEAPRATAVRSGGAVEAALSERSLSALIQMVAHGKSYVDFVDFSLIYLELQAQQQQLQQQTATTAGAKRG